MLDTLISREKRPVGREKRPVGRDGSQVDQAIKALRRLREAFSKARPEDIQELIGSIVSKIELHFDHEATEGGRQRSTFSHGTIYVRPDAGSGAESDPKSSLMTTNGPFLERSSGRRESLR